MIFDTHAHYDDARFDGDRGELLRRLPERGVGCVLNCGASLASSAAGRELAARYPHVFFAAGVHPDEAAQPEALGETEALARLRFLLADPKAAAVGEIGLDRHGDYPDKTSGALQEKWFRLQLRLARGLKKPVIVHSREAAADTLRILREEGGPEIRAVLHCFSYEKEMARRFLDLGYYLGVGGVVTYKNGRKLKEVVQYMPADRLLLETDCPYLAPEPFRGRRNWSLYLRYVVAEIAALRQISAEEVEAVTLENAQRFFGMRAPGAPSGEIV